MSNNPFRRIGYTLGPGNRGRTKSNSTKLLPGKGQHQTSSSKSMDVPPTGGGGDKQHGRRPTSSSRSPDNINEEIIDEIFAKCLARNKKHITGAALFSRDFLEINSGSSCSHSASAATPLMESRELPKNIDADAFSAAANKYQDQQQHTSAIVPALRTALRTNQRSKRTPARREREYRSSTTSSWLKSRFRGTHVGGKGNSVVSSQQPGDVSYSESRVSASLKARSKSRDILDAARLVVS
ncbi:unnamed protein product [Amoebophrya sp. A25]|nr:unnamed protein product [Amoebophrya sp. A25]|eukprot:GSA25T00025736001.1